MWFRSLALLLLSLVPLACSSSEAAGPSGSAAESPDPSAGGGGGGGTEPDAAVSSSSGSNGAGGGSSGVAPASGFVAEHGALQVVGNEIHDANGAPLQLRGMSLFWSHWASPFYNASLVASLARDWGATVVRAAITVEHDGYLMHPSEEMARLETIVDAAIAEGIYVIVDWHDHSADQHLEQSQTFFAAVAEKYGNVPNVLFEIWNEPVSVDWPTVKSYAQSVLGTIRGTGAQNLVIVGNPRWSSSAHVAADDPLTDGNVAYTLHFYAGSHGQDYRDDTVAALNKGVAVFVTEWGTCQADGNGAIDTVESQRWLDFLAEHHISWANWSLFDKDESCSALVPGSSPNGGWTYDDLTASGRFVKASLTP